MKLRPKIFGLFLYLGGNLMLKKRSKGISTLSKCEKCGKKFKVLYNSASGEKICEDCFFTELEENEKK